VWWGVVWRGGGGGRWWCQPTEAVVLARWASGPRRSVAAVELAHGSDEESTRTAQPAKSAHRTQKNQKKKGKKKKEKKNRTKQETQSESERDRWPRRI
jgi:hypothetical protein